ncbi:hypothetical protein AHIS1_p022 [Acaryochloris phage A-HIS1]|nr:hypothetical protein AHIS1_p022 [Acaryochloris phage A-HIS1]
MIERLALLFVRKAFGVNENEVLELSLSYTHVTARKYIRDSISKVETICIAKNYRETT